ncbi:hypothetical protein QJS10_CPA03g01906 [Acorus calamus]|uniref:RNase H type-1 domain-containing protein n=1 Tax=Acorus calamus TaxID=4465 RepID=A0AAV9F9D7_ACOCL|nr:hypothetical protein QJS10_CPA03g01906 [Acorus calamus]
MKCTIDVIWNPPSDGWLKVNSDGSKSNDRYAYGEIVRDQGGAFLKALSARVRAASINILELKGLVEGLRLCSTFQTKQIWLETDSTTVVAWVSGFNSDQMSSPDKIWWGSKIKVMTNPKGRSHPTHPFKRVAFSMEKLDIE